MRRAIDEPALIQVAQHRRGDRFESEDALARVIEKEVLRIRRFAPGGLE